MPCWAHSRPPDETGLLVPPAVSGALLRIGDVKEVAELRIRVLVPLLEAASGRCVRGDSGVGRPHARTDWLFCRKALWPGLL